MNSFSALVLTWLFGRWIFDAAELPGIGAQDVTPLTIFASAFSTLGLAMFGALAAWAIWERGFFLPAAGDLRLDSNCTGYSCF
jgi:hypothetical protein